MRSSCLVVLIALGGLAACAGAPIRERPEARASSMQFIASREVAATAASSAEDLLQRRRPHLLLPRALHGQPTREGTPLVYVDDVPQGGLSVLGLVPAQRIFDVRYLTWVEAESRFPGRHPAGVILIRTRSATPP
ncbi:MAG TPA: hypothetical protein VJT85_06725 [Gemmatimonadaceae bacterium]|nr:hypothetical protein [Gemmatimonadaceae bacterium]